jgi:hypothetical protein
MDRNGVITDRNGVITDRNGVKMISRRIVIFHTKYPNKFRASLRSAQFFLSPPPPLLEILDPPLHCHSISVIRLGVMFVLNLFVHGSLYTLKIPCQPGSMFCEILCIGVTGARAGCAPGSAPVMDRNGVITDRNGVITDRNGVKMNRNGAIINRN